MAQTAQQPSAAGQKQDLRQREITSDERQKRERAIRRFRELDTEYRTSWLTTHEDIIDFIQPNRGRFLQTDTNRGTRKDARVINNYATEKAGKLEAAIDVGVFSEAREWMVTQTENPADMEEEVNKDFCYMYQQAMFAGIAKAGWYAANRNAIGDLVGPAIGAVIIEEDTEKVARCTHIPVGQFRVAANSAGEVNVLCRTFTYTAAQMAEEFSIENCSIAVRTALRNQRTQSAKFTVLQLIEPRADIEREYGKVDAKNLPWASIWLELGQGYTGSVVPGQSEQSMPAGPLGLLRESGYHEQPFYVYRWNAIGQDAYGIDSPGWRGLGDAMQLQDMEMGTATVFATMVDPPKNRPDTLANASFLPGADNPIPGDQHVKFEPSYVPVPGVLEEGRNEKREVMGRLNAVFFGDLLFLLSGNQTQGDQKTAEEVRGIKEERLLQLGGVAARVFDAARIALRRFAGIFGRAGKLPPAPDKLLKKPGGLRIEFVNPLVSAQRAVAFPGIQQTISTAISIAEARKAGADQLDGDEILTTAVEMFGVKPTILKSPQQLAQERQAAAAQANAQAAQAAMPEAAGAIKQLGDTDPEKVQQMLQRFSPNAGAQGATPGA